jgi:hypothetical protein
VGVACIGCQGCCEPECLVPFHLLHPIIIILPVSRGGIFIMPVNKGIFSC